MAGLGIESQANPAHDWAETQEPSIIVPIDPARNAPARARGRSVDNRPPSADLGSSTNIPWGDSIAGHSIAPDPSLAVMRAIPPYDSVTPLEPSPSPPPLNGNYPSQQFLPGQASFAGGQAPFAGGQAPFGGGQAPFGGGQAQFAGGQAPFAGGQAPFAGGQAPFAGGQDAAYAHATPTKTPTRTQATRPMWESVMNIICFGLVLLLSIIVVALLGAGREDVKRSLYIDTFKEFKGAALLLSMAVITCPFVIAMLVLDIISAAMKSSFYPSNKYILAAITGIYVVLSYMLFGATCAALRGSSDVQEIFNEAYPYDAAPRFIQMFVGASVLGLFACFAFIVPLPILVVRSVDKLI